MMCACPGLDAEELRAHRRGRRDQRQQPFRGRITHQGVHVVVEDHRETAVILVRPPDGTPVAAALGEPVVIAPQHVERTEVVRTAGGVMAAGEAAAQKRGHRLDHHRGRTPVDQAGPRAHGAAARQNPVENLGAQARHRFLEVNAELMPAGPFAGGGRELILMPHIAHPRSGR
jgi:hypothetical protein